MTAKNSKVKTNAYAQQLDDLKAKGAHLLKEVGDQWQTPTPLFWGINAKFGPFVHDIFTDGHNSKCPSFYTAEDNALVQDWTKDFAGGVGFANPPYSRPCLDDDNQAITGMIKIIAKALAEREKGAKFVFAIKCAPSEVWWPEQADHVCFVRGRISFELPQWFIPANEKQEASSAGFGMAIVVFDKNWTGERLSYISRDALVKQGKMLLDMVEATAKSQGYIPANIKHRPDDSENGEQIDSSQMDIEDQIARAEKKAIWPNEVIALVEQAFINNPNKQNDYRYQHLCESANSQLLAGKAVADILVDFDLQLTKTQSIQEVA
ncbi:phage N-6-adenine-methyltransferase [Shewanella psychrophila]|uniref:Phage N-6-adenine-methyltransferase n=1 Tax=Shewanella psychrophila TaxID=225848 RepID=A0A1S6HXM9_9GAMM|nr:phage N-6-adenine-methyltransferase [Shewanella psychrophila]AQS40232.1 phage N-6-adenine-methyltransferase [Shewanella psychrophila]